MKRIRGHAGKDDAEEPPAGTPASAESREASQVEQAIDLEKEFNELHEDWEGEAVLVGRHGRWTTMQS